MARTTSSFFIQEASGDLVAVAPRVGGGVAIYTQASGATAWTGPEVPFGTEADVAGAALIEQASGDLDLIVLEGGRLRHYWYTPGKRWLNADVNDPEHPELMHASVLPGAREVAAGPALIQTGAGSLEVVAVVQQGLVLWHGDPSHGGWSDPAVFADGAFIAVSLVQSNYGDGNLEVLAVEDGHLVHFSQDAATGNWTRQEVGPASGVAGLPGFVQSASGSQGDFEVVAPVAGGLAHYRRDNDHGGVWRGPTRFGSGSWSAAALIEDAAGGLEAMALDADGALTRFVRDGAGTWSQVDVAKPAVCEPAQLGQAEPPIQSEIVGVHAAILKTGKLLHFTFDEGGGESRIIDPKKGTFSQPSGGGTQFCSGHAFLPDGRLFVAGGHGDMDVRSVHVFDPDIEAWSQEPDMPRARWYPTCTALPDGRVLVISGSLITSSELSADINNTLAFYDPTEADPEKRLGPELAVPSPWSRSSSFASFPTIDMYPFVFVLPSGQLLVHCHDTSRLYDARSNNWDPAEILTNYPHSRTYPGEGSAVLLALSPPDYRPRILVIGGGGEDRDGLTVDTPGTNTAEILDLDEATPAWRTTGSMQHGSVLVDAVLLPDGKVLALGGSATGAATMGVRPMLTTELFDPLDESWTQLCPIRVPRGYHGTAILLPDARVAVAGKDGTFQLDIMMYPERRLELFSPPYLFKGPRPTITAMPDQIEYGRPFEVGYTSSAGVDRAILMRPGAVTHQNNMEQRLVEMDHTETSATTLSVTAPPNANVAPPGHYMCFVLDSTGVPSVASFTLLS